MTTDATSLRILAADEDEGALERTGDLLGGLERHGVAGHAAFEPVRAQARANDRSAARCAAAVVDGHALLPPRP